MTKSILTITIIISLSFCITGCGVNPVTGEKELMLISEEQEDSIGAQYAPEIEKQLGGRIENDELQNYISSIGRKIVRVSHTPGKTFHFTAVNDKSVNALALPGGYIFITRGMLEKLTTEAQLASILAHETAHVTARHTSSAMSKQIGANILLTIASSKTDMSSSARTIASYGKQFLDMSFSRSDEKEADIGGLTYLERAGYQPQAIVETMEILDSLSKTKPIEFFSTHPNPENRKEYLEYKIRRRGYTGSKRIGKQEYKEKVLNNLPKKETQQ